MSAQYNITVNKNSDFRRSFQVKESGIILDITGYTFAGSLKENYQTTEKVDFFTVITDAPAGIFTIELSDTITSTMDPGTWVYDVIMTDSGGVKTRLFEGKAFVKNGVTA